MSIIANQACKICVSLCVGRLLKRKKRSLNYCPGLGLAEQYVLSQLYLALVSRMEACDKQPA